MAVIDLSTFNWTLKGWRPFHWKLYKSVETGLRLHADLNPIPAAVPGSVHKSLIIAGVIDQPYEAVQSRHSEWVEHRQWDYTTCIPAGTFDGATRIVLHAEALDYWGWLLIDGQEVSEFRNALAPFQCDLTDHLKDGQEHRLSIVFDMPPREQGQIGWTSRSQYFKPRYNYSWDWCPRWVSVGVQGPVELKTDFDAECNLDRLHTRLDDDLHTGTVTATIRTESAPEGYTARLLLKDGDTELSRCVAAAVSGCTDLCVTVAEVHPWWPNGCGEQHLYTVELSLCDTTGMVVWQQNRQVGFKHIAWKPCQNAPADAEPWICSVNGKDIFLQGVNWTPVHLNYLDADQQRYERLIELYRQMGCNLLRVWGGGILETQRFYELCDQAGIMVWQEFPLSSSGIDNQTPQDSNVLHMLEHIARSYVTRRAHHVSLLMWCGGNELDAIQADGHRAPLTSDDPCLGMLKRVVQELDPDRKYVPASPSGPSFFYDQARRGTGIHHDVHGPWDMNSFPDRIQGWRRYWDQDDAMFRSEVGLPAAASTEIIQRYAGQMPSWPPDGDYWQHSAAWWTQWWTLQDHFDTDNENELDRYVAQTQQEQADGLAYAAQCCKQRFPACGGFLVWMGHDLFPCPANTSIIQFDDAPKASYHALAQVFGQS